MKRLASLVLALGLGLGAGAQAQVADLVSPSAFRVCADPANAPFSTREETGFENRIADLFARELEKPVAYTWFPMATGFVRRTLGENRCDVIIGYAQGHELVLNTNHYYTSAYVLVTPEDSPLGAVDMLSDDALKGRKIGVIAGSPPATHLARNGLMADVEGYNLVVDRRHESPNEKMLDDLAAGEIEAALMWGPIAGPLAQARGGLTVTPLLKETLPPRLFFRITMGVRQGELVWKRRLNSAIRKLQPEIDAILIEAGVPLMDDMGTAVKQVSN